MLAPMLFLLLSAGMSACGTQSQASAYVSLNLEEKARRALDEQDYEQAIAFYSEHFETQPEDYANFPFLAAAYAGFAGFDIVEAAKANIEAGGSASLLDSLNTYLPSDPTPVQIDAMLQAKLRILALPPDHRDRSNETLTYASSAALQLELYQSSYAIMYLNQFTEVTPEGKLDASRLEEMSAADVEIILGNLEEIAAQSGTGVPAGASQIISQVDAQPGETRRDKLIKYLNPTGGS